MADIGGNIIGGDMGRHQRGHRERTQVGTWETGGDIGIFYNPYEPASGILSLLDILHSHDVFFSGKGLKIS